LERAADKPGPAKRRGFGLTRLAHTWQDPFWAFLKERGQALETYDWSGYVLVAMAEALSLEDFDDDGLTQALLKARPGACWLFQREGAEGLLERLGTAGVADAAQAAVQEALGEGEPGSASDLAAAARAGVAVLGRWLAQIGAGEVGLLTIG
jgi:hypothetical protein